LFGSESDYFQGVLREAEMKEGRGNMGGASYRFEFGKRVPLKKVEKSLLLAVVVAESLHGRSAMRLETSFQLDKEDRTCVVDGTTDVGRSIACVLTGLLSLEFGEEAFAVTRGAGTSAQGGIFTGISRHAARVFRA
jgi:hypothetical protein